MKRRVARVKVIQTLYQIDIAKTDWREALNNVLAGGKSDPFLEACVEGVVRHMDEIDQIISSCLHNWRLERLAHLDRAILRLAVFELRFLKTEDTPEQVVINEAIELAKQFSTEQSSKFINGVLSSVVNQGVGENDSAGN